ncbi:ScbA/BarX family gamma-butyrolactone biosynthesis protein [Streptomyces sp. G-G2]|uniref:ScbA/BarX family gamma-butyrolactone biosynthesis protein n=1 Tax=Streptomyces sp. G-G2 TaxID=3046201 RepID=UPI0024B9CD3D|nr:ScbA/BarX family gamma-butyrolactone biosynthesis protein [Streptomyces sp. G-G2]MDJ0382540.1 ScbA/BarX family gamma-butyrolactone biosynthesis protein [Streptomyces sp. G-G2]
MITILEPTGDLATPPSPAPSAALPAAPSAVPPSGPTAVPTAVPLGELPCGPTARPLGELSSVPADGLSAVPGCVCPVPDGPEQRLTSTVPRELVHRAAVAEVFLTGMCRPAEDRFHVTAQLPRGHSFFTPIAGTHYDPMMVCETIRQVGSYIAHEGFGVPLGHQFLLWGLDYTTVPENLVIGDTPASLDLEVTCSEIRMRGKHLQALRYKVVMRHEGVVVATGDVGYTVTSPAVYRRLRAEQLGRRPLPSLPSAPLQPAQVGRFSPFDVVLAATSPADTGVTWQLRYDTRHPVLFDHPGDHLPGMVLLEAARQAAVALTPAPAVMPVSVVSTYQRYAEFGTPLWIHAVRTGPATVRVTGTQDDEEVFLAVVGTGQVRAMPFEMTP